MRYLPFILPPLTLHVFLAWHMAGCYADARRAALDLNILSLPGDAWKARFIGTLTSRLEVLKRLVWFAFAFGGMGLIVLDNLFGALGVIYFILVPPWMLAGTMNLFAFTNLSRERMAGHAFALTTVGTVGIALGSISAARIIPTGLFQVCIAAILACSLPAAFVHLTWRRIESMTGPPALSAERGADMTG